MQIGSLIPRGVKRLLKSVLFLGLRFKWNYGRSSSVGISKRVHFLVVKDDKYVPAVRVAIESFLYWNSSSTAVVHCDGLTFKALNSSLRRPIQRGRVKVVHHIPNDKPWQVSKMDLILSLNGTDEVYMDSDLRWNGPCPKLIGPLFYVYEFELANHPDFVDLSRDLLSKTWPAAQMYNTSFVYFDNLPLHEQQINQVYRLYSNINDWSKNTNIEEARKNSFERLSEQIAVSVVICSALKIGSLKSADSRADGQFVESSYLGATGLGF